MLIAADICFWDELVDPVFNMVNRAVRAGVKHIIIADPERSTFLDMARRCEKRFCAEGYRIGNTQACQGPQRDNGTGERVILLLPGPAEQASGTRGQRSATAATECFLTSSGSLPPPSMV
ncbi:MAG: hypothetical protein R3E50_14165 [Halioglobus sp.]